MEVISEASHYNKVNQSYNRQKFSHKLAETMILYQECYSRSTWPSFINKKLQQFISMRFAYELTIFVISMPAEVSRFTRQYHR